MKFFLFFAASVVAVAGGAHSSHAQGFSLCWHDLNQDIRLRAAGAYSESHLAFMEISALARLFEKSAKVIVPEDGLNASMTHYLLGVDSGGMAGTDEGRYAEYLVFSAYRLNYELIRLEEFSDGRCKKQVTRLSPKVFFGRVRNERQTRLDYADVIVFDQYLVVGGAGRNLKLNPIRVGEMIQKEVRGVEYRVTREPGQDPAPVLKLQSLQGSEPVSEEWVRF